MLVRMASTPRPLEVGFFAAGSVAHASRALRRPLRAAKSARKNFAVRSADLLADQITTLAAAKELLIG